MNDNTVAKDAKVTITAENVAVDTAYYWRGMEDCPIGSKVQLLTAGGLPQYGRWDGRNPFYVGWAPLPKRRPASDGGAA
ncbi:hypothetical protein QFZ83_002169 [Variovorax sp. W1I1]|nr:hypothetical protein [Variovorax sp. W1I1]